MIAYFKRSWEQNPTATAIEAVETVLMSAVVFATYYYANDFGAVGEWLIPAYLLSSILAVISAVMRNSSKVLLYSLYVIFNTLALIKIM